MAVHEYRCECGTVFAHLTGAHIAGGGEAARCPECGSHAITQLLRPFKSVVERDDLRDIHPLEREMALENKRVLEAESEQILSGESRIIERGPKEFRPVLPDHLKKYSK